MREGANPAKDANDLAPFKRQRVIVPVYIPNTEGYFEHAIEILKLCLDSLHVTAQGQASVTVISNGCIPEVVDLLHSYLDDHRIDQLILNNRNWGKIDASLSALRGRFEELLTIADADVLFRPGWLQAIEDVFRAFPECGFVTPAPQPSLAFLHTTSTILSAGVSGELGFEALVPSADLDRFARSIGRPDLLRPEQRRVQMVVRRNGAAACVGGGHFVFAMRRELAWRLPRRPSLTALRPLGETAWFDDPPDAMGAWRLATPRVYADHMGNVPEPWMYEELDRTRAECGRPARPLAALPPMRPSPVAMIPFSWRQLGARAVRKFYLERRWVNVAADVERQHAAGH